MKTLVVAPVFNFVIFYLVGILLARYFGYWAGFPGIPGLLMVLLCEVIFRKKVSFRKERWVTFGILLIFTGAGAINYQLRLLKTSKPDLNVVNCGNAVLLAKITHQVRKNHFGRSAWAELIAYRIDSTWTRAGGGFQLFVKIGDTTEFARFDTVAMKGYVTNAYSRNQGYLSYLHHQGIFYSVYVNQLIPLAKEKSWHARLEYLRQEIGANLKAVIADSIHQGIALAMFLGERSAMDRAIKQVFTDAGLSHILAISGLHVGIVFLVLNFLLSPFHLFLHGQRMKNILILVLLLCYMFITGASPSVVRASLMFSLILVLRVLFLRYQILNIVATAALIQLLINPPILFNIGFQLSYSAVLGIILFLPVLERYFSSDQLILRTLFGWIAVTICASVATLPLVLIHFGRFPTYFLLSNILASFLSFMLVLSGFFTVLFSYVPIVSEWLGMISNALIELLLFLARAIAALPHAVIDEVNFHRPGIWIIFTQLILAGLILSLPRWSSWLAGGIPGFKILTFFIYQKRSYHQEK